MSSLVWQPSCTSTTTFGALGSITAGDTLKDVVIINTGANPVYVGSGSAAAGASTGLQVPAGGQVTVLGYSVTAGTATTGNVWAQTAGTGLTSSTVAGMTSVQGNI